MDKHIHISIVLKLILQYPLIAFSDDRELCYCRATKQGYLFYVLQLFPLCLLELLSYFYAYSMHEKLE